MNRPYLILGNPENRRVTHFQEALALEGRPPAQVVAWLDFLRDPSQLDDLPDEPLFLRLDSAGENEAVERMLLTLGEDRPFARTCRRINSRDLAALAPSHGRIICPRQAHLGFERALEVLDGVLERHPNWSCLSPTRDVRELFDKRQTSRRYANLGIPVPEALPEVATVDELVSGLEARGWTDAFVKMSASSSASCLGVLHLRPGRHSLHTTIEQARDGWFNTLKVRHVVHPERVHELLQFLLDEGAQVERAIPKARLDGAYFDLRVLCIAHEPRFIVVRQNHHVITNLHLGGWRGELANLLASVPETSWAAAMESCRQVARCYQALHVGIDLMFEPHFDAHRIIEANAFGDLLPRLELDGRNVWQWEIRAADTRF